MKKINHLLLAVVSGFVFFSCGLESSENSKKISYSYDPESSTLEWTAFKFTEKAGVKGTFNDLVVSGIDSSEDPKKMIESLSFSIPTASVETLDPERNENIVNYFFKSAKTEFLKGRIIELNDSGVATFELTMNEITKTVTSKYTLTGKHFTLRTIINLLEWNAKSAMDDLNEQCAINHSGTDGILKLWSEVEISFTTKLTEKEIN